MTLGYQATLTWTISEPRAFVESLMPHESADIRSIYEVLLEAERAAQEANPVPWRSYEVVRSNQVTQVGLWSFQSSFWHLELQ